MPNRRRASRRALPLSGPCQLTVAKRGKSWRAYVRPEFQVSALGGGPERLATRSRALHDLAQGVTAWHQSRARIGAGIH